LAVKTAKAFRNALSRKDSMAMLRVTEEMLEHLGKMPDALKLAITRNAGIRNREKHEKFWRGLEEETRAAAAFLRKGRDGRRR